MKLSFIILIGWVSWDNLLVFIKHLLGACILCCFLNPLQATKAHAIGVSWSVSSVSTVPGDISVTGIGCVGSY